MPDSWCPRREAQGHARRPNGPCEDVGLCNLCLAPSADLRPLGEVHYNHDDNCTQPWHWGPCSDPAPVVNGTMEWLIKFEQTIRNEHYAQVHELKERLSEAQQLLKKRERCTACAGTGRCTDPECWCIHDVCVRCKGTGKQK